MLKKLIPLLLAILLCDKSLAISCAREGRGNVPGCPFIANAATGDGQMTMAKLPPKASAILLRNFNSHMPVCSHRANNIIAVHSKYIDGMVYMLEGSVVMGSERVDRVFLADLIVGKVLPRDFGRPACKLISEQREKCMYLPQSCEKLPEPNSSASSADEESP